MARLPSATVGCIAALLLGTLAASPAFGQEPRRELTVHLAQANNSSPYAFVRAKFAPGEVADPWAVRFCDPQGRDRRTSSGTRSPGKWRGKAGRIGAIATRC